MMIINLGVGMSIEKQFQAIDFPHLGIKFNISFCTEDSNHLIKAYSGDGPRPLPSLSMARNTSADAHVIFRESLSQDEVQEAVGKAIRDHLKGDKRIRATHGTGIPNDERMCSNANLLVWTNVAAAIGTNKTLPKYVQLNVDLKIHMNYTCVYVVGERGINCMGISGIPLLKISVEQGEDMKKKKCCSICLMDIDADATVMAMTMRMPCQHVFHAGCIAVWFKRSHNCPLCRYEMPTQ